MMVDMLKSLEQDLRRYRLVHSGERVGVAVSGGADSVALLRGLVALAPELGIVPVVLHLNHQLRGKESDADESFVAALAEQLSLEAAIGSVHVTAHEGRSLEAAGRRARYAFFLHAAADHRLDSVATAHTREDQAETVLLRLLRGSGTSGLAGILRVCDLSALAQSPLPPAARAGAAPPRLIRPLLCISRRKIASYLRLLRQPFRLDASNREPRFLRNRVRAELLPALERDYNPQLRQALCETAEVAAGENEFLEDLVSQILASQRAEAGKVAGAPEAGVEVALFQPQPAAVQRRILRRLCQPHTLALDFDQLERRRELALAGAAGSLQLPRGFAAEMVRRPPLPPRLRLLAS